MKAIIIEGPDGMGKSILANQLGDVLGLPVVRCGASPRTREGLIDWVHYQDVLINKGDVILDRVTMFSQIVYDHALGRAPQQHEGLLAIARRLIPMISLIYCYSEKGSVHTVKDYDDPDHVIAIEKCAAEVHKRYCEMFIDLGVTPWQYDWRTQGALDLLIPQLETDNEEQTN